MGDGAHKLPEGKHLFGDQHPISHVGYLCYRHGEEGLGHSQDSLNILMISRGAFRINSLYALFGKLSSTSDTANCSRCSISSSISSAAALKKS